MADPVYCQVCARTMTSRSMFGTNADGSAQPAYCVDCFKDGDFIGNGALPLEELQRKTLEFMVNEEKMTEEDAKKIVDGFPNLIKWRGLALPPS